MSTPSSPMSSPFRAPLEETTFSSIITERSLPIPLSSFSIDDDQEEEVVVEFEVAPLPPHGYNTRLQKKKLQEFENKLSV